MHSRPYGERDAEWSLNADGTVVTGVDDEPAPEQADPVDAAIERLNRMRPQELFETFADMELAWGPTWSGSLKSLWLGDGEAIGDIVVGEELAEHLGTEPMHPVLMDLCTGVAFPAFPALLAAEQGVNDLFLPLRYGQVMLREKMPRRFYCRARWHTSGLDSETQVFDLDFVDRDGRQLGGIREFTVKRAPREALLRGLGGDATRLLYTLGWHEVPPPASSDERRRRERHLADCRIRRTGGQRAGLHPVRPDHRSGALGTAVGTGSRARCCRSPASSGAARRPSAEESSAECRRAARDRDRQPAQRRAHRAGAGRQRETARRTVDHHRAGRGHRIRRAGRPGAGGAVGIRAHHRSTRNRRCAANWSIATDHDGGRAAHWPTCSPHRSTSRNSHCDKESCWPRGCCRGRAAVISRCRAQPTTSWHPPNAARSTTCV